MHKGGRTDAHDRRGAAWVRRPRAHFCNCGFAARNAGTGYRAVRRSGGQALRSFLRRWCLSACVSARVFGVDLHENRSYERIGVVVTPS